MKAKALAFWFLPIWTCSVVFAQSGPDNDPSQAQGYVDNYFHHTDFDSINQYNGQLTIPIPIGPVYQIGPNLTFQAVLTYNTRLTEPGKPVPIPASETDYLPIIGDPALGIGWTFTAGKIACGALTPGGSPPAKPCYVRPDGAQIDFPAGGGLTSDGSQYKLVHNGSFPNDTYTMWDGDGSRFEFTRLVRGYDDNPSTSPGYVHDFGRSRDGYYLEVIEDPFGNRLTVTYAADGVRPCQRTTCSPSQPGTALCPSNLPSWVPDTFKIQRTSESVSYDVFKVVTETTAGPTFGRIKALQARTLVGVTPQFSQWNLTYGSVSAPGRSNYCSSPTPTTLWTVTGIGLPTDITGTGHGFSYHSGNVAQALMKTMSLPTGATVFYDYGSYTFHHARPTFLPQGCVPTLPPPTLLLAGIWRSTIATDSGAGNRPEVDPNPRPREPAVNCGEARHLQRIVGVLERTVEAAGMPDSVTTYTQYALPYGETDDDSAAPNSHTLTLALLPADSNGNRRAESTLFWAARQGLQDIPTPGDRLGAVIRHAVFETDPNPTTLQLPNGPSQRQDICGGSADGLCATHAIRVTQKQYEYGVSEPTDGTNRRLKSATTYYGHITATDPLASDYCPAGCLKNTVSYSLSAGKTWEGNGRHYNIECQSAATTCNPAALLTGERKTTTIWNPQDTATTHFSNLYSQETTFEQGVVSPGRNTLDRYFFFNPANGFLDAELALDAPTTRVLERCPYPERTAVNPYPPTGNVVNEVTATKIVSLPLTSNPCVAAPAPPASAIQNWTGIGTNSDTFGQRMGYGGGLVARKLWTSQAATQPPSWFSYQVDRDGATGWITTTYDTAGLQTTFQYDSLGRVTLVTPPGGEAPTTIMYTSPTQTTVSRDGSDDDSWQQFRYDGLGRLIREIRQMPSGYSFRTRSIDAAGNEYFGSEWKACTSVAANGNCIIDNPTLGTTLSNFDPFGRAQTITKADDSVTTISFTDTGVPYSDTRKAITVNNVGCTWNGTSCTGGSPATTAYRYDIYGRLTTALEPGGDITTYNYDVAGKLSKVTQGTQTARTFAYDSLGFLLTESTPEAGTVDYRPTGQSYSNFGSLGNLLGKKEGSPQITRSYRYDHAGRELCEISGTFGSQTCDTATNLYVRNFYDGDGFPGGNHKLGKLTRRDGYNRNLSPTRLVREEFTYSDPTGRLSQMTTSVRSGTNFTTVDSTAAQSWTYDALGLVKTHGHPRASGTFTVTNTRSMGYVAGITASGQIVVTTATYNPSGGLASWRGGNGLFGNGVLTTITQDSSLLPRPSRISTTEAAETPPVLVNFDSGTYRYDGAGNIAAIGTDLFGHDLRSRLTSADYGAVQGRQLFAYDRYGNLLSTTHVIDDFLTTTEFCVTTCASNKLGSPYTYDTRGNLKTFGTAQTLTYDDLSRQVREQATGGVDWRYLYSGAGERTAKLPASGTAQYTYRDEATRIVTEYNGATLGRDNVFLGNLLVASLINTSQAGSCPSYPCWEWYHSDHLGTPRLVTSAGKTVLDSRKYWPYGDGVPGQAPTLQKLRFAAMERDSETTGQTTRYYDHARMHVAVPGRFTSPDKIGGGPEDPQSWNRYAYVTGNPLRFADPDGQFIVPVLIGLGVIGGFLAAEPLDAPGPADSMHSDAGGGQAFGRLIVGAGLLSAPAASPGLVGDAVALMNRGPERSFDRPESLRGASADEVRQLVPSEFRAEATRRGAGQRFVDPNSRGDQIRMMPGNPRDPNPVKQGPYLRISRSGSTTDPIPLRGNPTLRKSFTDRVLEYLRLRKRLPSAK